MGRRKKEPEWMHRAAIAEAAQQLFQAKGVALVTMDDIAKQAHYSKATLYVYFQNKDEILSYITLSSMQKLQACIEKALLPFAYMPSWTSFSALCQELSTFAFTSPFQYEQALSDINVDLENPQTPPIYRDIFACGENINQLLKIYIENGIQAGELLPDIDILPAIFVLWSSLSGILQLALHKKKYFSQHLHMEKDAFLTQAFQMLYRTIAITKGDMNR